MLKKLAVVAAVLAFAVPAFAKGTKVTVGGLDVTGSLTVANTGVNSTTGKNASVKTGNATAGSFTTSDMNDVYVKGGKSSTTVNASGTDITVGITAANSGVNSSSKGSVNTGNAGAYSVVGSSMNTVVVK